MPQFLTPEQIQAIKRIIEKRHSAVILKVLGKDALTPEERVLLEQSGINLEGQINVIKDAYLYGQLKEKLDTSDPRLDYEGFKQEIEKNPIPLSQPELFAIEAAEQHAGAHIRHLGAKIEQQTSHLIFREDNALRARLLKEIVPEVKINIEKQESIGKLKKELQDNQQDWSRDWNRVAITEKTNSMLQGQADAIKRQTPDPLVFKLPAPTCCDHCARLYIGPDGQPRIFRLSTLEANGTNVGLKAKEWRPVVGTMHPHCQCQLSKVPEGWGFDESGDLVPGGKLGVREEEPVKKSLLPQIAAGSSQMGNRAISQSSKGVSLSLGMPFNHQGAQTQASTIKKFKEHLAAFSDEDRQFMIKLDPGDYTWLQEQPLESVHPVEDNEERKRMDKDVLKDIPKNKARLELDIQKRLKASNPNLIIKGSGLFIGPRGGLWADPLHTIPFNPNAQFTHVKESKAPPEKEVTWKEGLPPGIPKVDWSSWKKGHRGGTEELHYNSETHEFDPERQKLHKKIVQKFFKQGKKHQKGSDVAPTAIISMGGPASGKSSILKSKFGDTAEYVKIDSDKIKEELPEYQSALKEHYKSAAEIVHAESTVIANDLLSASTKAKKNLVFDTTGADFTRLQNQIQKLKAAGYRIALVMPYVALDEAKKRAKARGEQSGRWIPEEAIEDVYKKVPHSFVQALQHVETAYLYDNSGESPKDVFEKHGDHSITHDPKTAALFPGLPVQKSDGNMEGSLVPLLRSLAQTAAQEDSLPLTQTKTYKEHEGFWDVDQFRCWVCHSPD